jgi:xanthine/CO dehydrogenase XdhC/CoxF family maturation factor
MLERGLPAARVAALRAPAGLDIGAATAQEIALSILAEIVRHRRREAVVGDEPGVERLEIEGGEVESRAVSPVLGACEKP